MTTLTTTQRTAAITELRAVVTYLSGVAAGRIVDRICATTSPFGSIIRKQAYDQGFTAGQKTAGGYSGGYR